MRPRIVWGLMPAFLVLDGFVALSFHIAWLGQWNWTIDTAIGSTVLSGPLAASASGWLAGIERKRAALNDTTPRGWQTPVRCALEVATTATAALLATTLVMLAATASTVHGGPFTPWSWLLAPAVLIFCALLGALAGHYAPHLIIAILAGPAVFVLGSYGGRLLWMLLRHGPQSGSLAGLRWDPITVIGESAGLLGCSLAVVAWFSVAGRRSRSPLALVPLAAALLIAFPVMVHDRSRDGFRYVVERPTACTGASPQVCVAPSDRHRLEPTARAVRQAAEALRPIVSPPDRFEYLAPGYQLPRRGVGVVSTLAGRTTSHVLAYVGAASVAEPANCAAFTDPRREPPSRALESMVLVSAWIVRHAGGHAEGDTARAERWLRLPTSQQAPWLRATYGQLADCELEAIRLPWE